MIEIIDRSKIENEYTKVNYKEVLNYGTHRRKYL